MSAVSLSRVYFNYQGEQLFTDLNWKIPVGARLGLVGKNGCGKTTLLRLITGSLFPDRGTIDVSGKLKSLLGGSGILKSNFTGYENLRLLQYKYSKYDRLGFCEIVSDFLEFSELGESKLSQILETWSTGQKMRMAAFDLINSMPDVLLMDEFVGGLDKDFSQKFSKQLIETVSKKTTILIASHDDDLLNMFSCEKMPLEYLKSGKI